jgi:hypothetical protein
MPAAGAHLCEQQTYIGHEPQDSSFQKRTKFRTMVSLNKEEFIKVTPENFHLLGHNAV